jgi:hypothetical protein
MDQNKLTIAQIDALLEELELKKITLNVLNEQLERLNTDLKTVKYLVDFMDRVTEIEDEHNDKA